MSKQKYKILPFSIIFFWPKHSIDICFLLIALQSKRKKKNHHLENSVICQPTRSDPDHFLIKKNNRLNLSAIKMANNEQMMAGLNSQERVIAVAKRLTDIGDELERKSRKNSYFSYGSWMCFITVILTVTAYYYPSRDPNMSCLWRLTVMWSQHSFWTAPRRWVMYCRQVIGNWPPYERIILSARTFNKIWFWRAISYIYEQIKRISWLPSYPIKIWDFEIRFHMYKLIVTTCTEAMQFWSNPKT